jgi:hypothetical protein
MNPFHATDVQVGQEIRTVTQAAPKTRPFRVHARHVDSHHARVLDEASFEAAAVAFVEDFHPPLTEEHEISVIVRDLGSGHEHCFRIDLDTGESELCG